MRTASDQKHPWLMRWVAAWMYRTLMRRLHNGSIKSERDRTTALRLAELLLENNPDLRNE